MNIGFWFILYIIYSMLGWLMEVINALIREKKFINRGFLIGPYCPIYGKGALLVILLLKNYHSNPLVLFVLSIAICSVIEYSGSYILEKLFNTSWWDYSNRKYNINGRICLETMIPFGIGCLILMYVINPFLTKFILLIPTNILNIIAIILFISYVIDVVVSFRIIWKFKEVSKNAKVDSTEKVTEYVKEVILERRKVLYTRLIKAFPSLKIRNIKKK